MERQKYRNVISKEKYTSIYLVIIKDQPKRYVYASSQLYEQMFACLEFYLLTLMVKTKRYYCLFFSFSFIKRFKITFP